MNVGIPGVLEWIYFWRSRISNSYVVLNRSVIAVIKNLALQVLAEERLLLAFFYEHF